MPLTPIFEPFKSKPPSQYKIRPKTVPHAIIRDNFTIASWLLIGAGLQSFLYTVLPYRSMAITLSVFGLLSVKFVSYILRATGLTQNERFNEVIRGRSVIAYPGQSGTIEKMAENKMCAILLSGQNNSPLGILNKDFKTLGDFFSDMISDLDANGAATGYLGSSAWTGASPRYTCSETMAIVYFKDAASLQQWAHGKLHTEAMLWYSALGDKAKYLGVMHELYEAPAGGWEGIYLNYAPTGLGVTYTQVKGADGKEAWVNPLVRGRAQQATMAGRMGVKEHAWPEYNPASYDNQEV